MIDTELAGYRESVRPAPGSTTDQYTMTVTSQTETSHGIAWTATLTRNSTPIGTVEDHGHGGYPDIHITDPAEQHAWSTMITAAYPHSQSGEEDFIAHLDFVSEGM
jgi:hypothetical protein